MDTKEVLLNIRKKNNLSQAEMAEKLYVTRQAVSRWETGETKPNIETLKLISKKFDISVNALLDFSSIMKKIWIFSDESNMCGLRTAGVLVRNYKILVQRERDGIEYALPGGAVKFGETSENSLVMRFKEETGVDILCNRLIWIEELFWKWENKNAHGIAFYYLISLKDENNISDDYFGTNKANSNVVFEWIAVDEINDITIFPSFIKENIKNISESIGHFVSYDY